MQSSDIRARTRKFEERPISLQCATRTDAPVSAPSSHHDRRAAQAIIRPQAATDARPAGRVSEDRHEDGIGDAATMPPVCSQNLRFPGVSFWLSVLRALMRGYFSWRRERRISANIDLFRELPDWALYDIGISRGQIAEAVRANAPRDRGPRDRGQGDAE